VNLRIKYGKNAKGRFLSHLDLMRAWERTLRRAHIPIAFSQGFNPHPKLSFGSALAVGVTSSGEYMDIELKKSCSIKEIKSKLEKYLPTGLEVYEIVEIDNKASSLMATINRARYIVQASLHQPISQEELDKFLARFLEQSNIIIVRETKKGKKEKDIKEGIFTLKGKILDNTKIQFELLVETGHLYYVQYKFLPIADLQVQPPGFHLHWTVQ